MPEKIIKNKIKKQTYIAILNATLHTFSAFHTAFLMFARINRYYKKPNRVQLKLINTTIKQLHCDNMPLEPDSYKQLQNHPHAHGFEQIILTEISILQSIKT